MAGIKISNLPPTVTAQGTDVFPCDQSGPITKKTTLNQVATLFNGNFVQLSPPADQTISGSSNLGIPSGSISAGNIKISSNQIITTNTNGNINIVPDGTGVITIGSSTQLGAALLQVAKSSTQGSGLIGTYLNTNQAALFNLIKSRSTTPGTQVTVQNNDQLGSYYVLADDGTSFPAASRILTSASGTISTGVVPAKMELQTANSSGTLTTALTISNAQVVTLANVLPAGSGGTGVANTGTWANGGNVAFSGAFTFSGTLTGNTAVTYPTSGTLATTAQTFPFVNVTGTTQAAAVNTGYVIGNASSTTVTLPVTAAIGDRISIVGNGTAGWVLTANTGQTIKIGSSTTSSAGSLASTSQYDQIEVCCVVANTTWVTRSVLSSGVTVT